VVMKLVMTSHVMRRFLERTIKTKLEKAFLVPPKIITSLDIVNLPINRIKEKGYLYAYYPGQNELFFLQVKGGELVVKSFIVLQPVLEEHLKKLIEEGHLKKVGEEYPVF